MTAGVTTDCTTGGTSFVLPVKVGLSTAGSTVTKVQGTISAFKNPFSVTPTTVSISYLNGCTGTPANTNTWTFSQFQPGTFASTAVKLTSSSTVIGATGAILTASFNPSTLLQVKGIIQLTVPPYFTLSTGSQGSIVNYDPNNMVTVNSPTMTVSNVNYNPTTRAISF